MKNLPPSHLFLPARAERPEAVLTARGTGMRIAWIMPEGRRQAGLKVISAVHIPVSRPRPEGQVAPPRPQEAAEERRGKPEPQARDAKPRVVNAGLMAALFLGIGCIIAALVSGMVFSPQSPADWQIVQAWRIEWLLGAIAFFLLGLLLHALRSRG